MDRHVVRAANGSPAEEGAEAPPTRGSVGSSDASHDERAATLPAPSACTEHCRTPSSWCLA